MTARLVSVTVISTGNSGGRSLITTRMARASNLLKWRKSDAFVSSLVLPCTLTKNFRMLDVYMTPSPTDISRSEPPGQDLLGEPHDGQRFDPVRCIERPLAHVHQHAPLDAGKIGDGVTNFPSRMQKIFSGLPSTT